jgi:hypothetical protein
MLGHVRIEAIKKNNYPFFLGVGAGLEVTWKGRSIFSKLIIYRTCEILLILIVMSSYKI